MTDYGAMARRHWERWLPHRYSQIPDPTEFFSTLGQQVEQEIDDLALELEGRDEPGETYLAKVGRLNNARMRAREIVLPEQVLLPPEPGTDPDEETDQTATSGGSAQGWSPSEGIPLEPIGPEHPYWSVLMEQEQLIRDSSSDESSVPPDSTSSPRPGNAPG
jgi:hypothetical protein